MKNLFDLSNKIVVITGGAGFLGRQYAEAICAHGGTVIILDLDTQKIRETTEELNHTYHKKAYGFSLDITIEENVKTTCQNIIEKFNKVDVLINNAANNPKVDSSSTIKNTSRLENFSLDEWNQDITVGLTGAFLCTKYFGEAMAKQNNGHIINISSDLGIIAPNQSLYTQPELEEKKQNVKPVSYTVTKTALIGLTRYTATYWGHKNVRSNAICFGGVFNEQGEDFLNRINTLIPMKRMAKKNEYQGTILYLVSDASSYMNGSTLIIDGGRSCW